jgi:hypothetical protein
MTAIDMDAAARLARDHLNAQIELVPCAPSDGCAVFRVVDRNDAMRVGADRYISVHLLTGSVAEFEAGE